MSANHRNTRSQRLKGNHANPALNTTKSVHRANQAKGPVHGKLATGAVPMHLHVADIRVELATAKAAEDEVASAVVADAVEEVNEVEVDGEVEAILTTTKLRLVAMVPLPDPPPQRPRYQHRHRLRQGGSLERYATV